MNNPLIKLEKWWMKAKDKSPLNQKSAICLSTINNENYPSSRFVDLKEIETDGLIFCTSYDSPKGDDIKNNSKVAIAIWWDHVGYQVRVTGNAEKIKEKNAVKYWDSRKAGAKIATLSFNQSKEIKSQKLFLEKTKVIEDLFLTKKILKPINWGGYIVKPVSIEFLQFNQNRLHVREHYQLTDNIWTKKLLQP